jgi:membrane associated rhomboid family serine protease
MKLKQLAALLLRIIGVCFVLSGFSEALYGILDTHKTGAIAAAMGGLIVGALTVYFSRKLAGILCRGLDDDSA